METLHPTYVLLETGETVYLESWFIFLGDNENFRVFSLGEGVTIGLSGSSVEWGS